MHLVFDMDGVLLDSETDLSWLDRALKQTLRELGVSVTPNNREALFPATSSDFEQFASRIGVSVTELWDIRDAMYQSVKTTAIESGEIRPFDDVSTLYSLPDDLEFHIISNSPKPVVESFVTANNYTDLFSTALGRGSSYEALHKLKPHPHLYEELILATDDASLDCAYVGHTTTDRQFAENTGMNYVPLDRTSGETLSTIVSQVETHGLTVLREQR